MAKQRDFEALYCIRAVLRRFNATVSIAMYISTDPDALTGVRVYRGLDHSWIKTVLGKDFKVDDNLKDNTELSLIRDKETNKLPSIGNGYTFTESVPPLFQYFQDSNGNTISRVVDTVSGVIMESDSTNVSSAIRRTMLFRLTAIDDAGQHRYGIPSRKRYWEDLADYFVGEGTRNYEDFVEYVNKLDDSDKKNMEE